MTTPNPPTRVLAMHPTSRGFGFAILEGPRRLIDWGTKDARRASNERTLALVAGLLDQYVPEAIVLQDARDREFRRCPRVGDLIEAIRSLAAGRKIRVRSFARRQVRAILWSARAVTKHQVAAAIAQLLPELAPRLPPRRKPWMSQDERMSIFDAVALALVFYRRAELDRRASHQP